MQRESKSFWTSIPGILSGVALIITAITGLYIAFNNASPDLPNDSNSGFPEKLSTLKETNEFNAKEDVSSSEKMVSHSNQLLIIEENFNGPNSYFPEISKGSSKYLKRFDATFMDGHYHWEIDYHEDSWGEAYHDIPNVRLENFESELKFRFTNISSDDVFAGLTFGTIKNMHYSLFISREGWMKVAFFNGNGYVDLFEWRKINDFRPKEFNTIKLKVEDKMISVTVNDDLLINEFPEDGYVQGMIGLFVYGNNKNSAMIDFDKFVLRKLE